VALYHNMGRILNMEDQEGKYRSLLTSLKYSRLLKIVKPSDTLGILINADPDRF